MVKKWKNLLGKIKRVASKCRKDLKEELKSWRRIFFNVLVQLLIGILRKSPRTSRPRLTSPLSTGDSPALALVRGLSALLGVTRVCFRGRWRAAVRGAPGWASPAASWWSAWCSPPPAWSAGASRGPPGRDMWWCWTPALSTRQYTHTQMHI